MSLLSKYQWLNSCAGLEVNVLADGSRSVRYCAISLAKNDLNIDRKIESAGADADLRKLPADRPLAVSVTGRGVLIKKTSRLEDLTGEKLSHLFPNLKPEQFYIQNFISGDYSFISLIRRELVDDLLAQLEKAGLKVLLINAGPFAAGHILSQLNCYGEEIGFDGHFISTRGSIWEDYRPIPDLKSKYPVKIGIEPIQEQYLLSYAAAFQLALYRRLNVVSLPVPRVEENLLSFEQKQKLSFRMRSLLFAFFLLLLVNFLLFSYYNDQNEKLLKQVNQHSTSAEALQQVERTISRNETALKELGWNNGISKAWVADQIGQSVPPRVKLTELSVAPLDKTESTRQRKEIFETGKVKISGEAEDAGVVNDWLHLLKSKPWVKQVNLESFSPSDENENQVFTLSLTLN